MSKINKKAKIYEPNVIIGNKMYMEINSEMYGYSFINTEGEVLIKEGVHISAYFSKIGNGKLTVGKNTKIAPRVTIVTSSQKTVGGKMKRVDNDVNIGSNVFIGSNVIIMPGVSVGDNSVVGAGLYINEDILSNTKVIPIQKKKIIELKK